MIKCSALDEAFAEILRKGAPYFWIVLHECLHPNGNKRRRVVIVLTVDTSVRIYLGFHIGFEEEQ